MKMHRSARVSRALSSSESTVFSVWRQVRNGGSPRSSTFIIGEHGLQRVESKLERRGTDRPLRLGRNATSTRDPAAPPRLSLWVDMSSGGWSRSSRACPDLFAGRSVLWRAVEVRPRLPCSLGARNLHASEQGMSSRLPGALGMRTPGTCRGLAAGAPQARWEDAPELGERWRFRADQPTISPVSSSHRRMLRHFRLSRRVIGFTCSSGSSS